MLNTNNNPSEWFVGHSFDLFCLSFLDGNDLACSKGLKLVGSSHPSFSTEDASSQCITVWNSTGTQPLVLKGMLECVF